MAIPLYTLEAGSTYYFTAKAEEPISDTVGNASMAVYMTYTAPNVRLNRTNGEFAASNVLNIQVLDVYNPDRAAADRFKYPLALTWTCEEK